jgi:hypothetical protein
MYSLGGLVSDGTVGWRNSNLEPFLNNRDVKDGRDEDLTQVPEMIRAFRNT